MPKDRYRLYHVEKAKGGVALTMTAGSAIVSEDSPAPFGNLHAYKDEQREITGAFAGGAILLLLAGGGLSLRWFRRLI